MSDKTNYQAMRFDPHPTQQMVDACCVRIAELEGIITAAIPFIGHEAYVPELVQRAEDAVDYGAEEWSRDE